MSRGQKKERTLAKELGALLAETLLPSLRVRARAGPVDAVLRQRWEHERAEERTAEGFDDWVGQLIEQVGAAWVLSCVFVRTLEDRGLVPRRRLAGEGAADSEHYFYELAPSLNARDYLLTVFKELSRFPGTEELLGRGNPAWRLAPGGSVAQELLDFFREEKDTSLKWTFSARAEPVEGRVAESSTRFLGDLYQDLSESVRERYALLQTPDFVERFILGLTLDPAIQEFGLEEVRVIDPTCGSGHFLLGAYDRLFEARLAAKPGLDRRQHALAALEQVFGVDINPYAVAITRFRLTLAYLEKAGLTRLADAPKLPHNVVVADSLLYGARGVTRDFAEIAGSKRQWGDSLFTLEEPDRAVEVLSRGYHVVVGNPPYITCKDAKLREKYRRLYPRSAAGKYALAAPFTERFFRLGSSSAFIGLINSNSFMKREFGKKLIEEVLPKLDLTHVVDTSGAYIPGHGTPTVILVGRNRAPVAAKVRAVLGKRGEPETPTEPATGRVWSSIVGHLGEVGFEDQYLSIAEVERAMLAKHPWSLGGGGAAELKELLENRAQTQLCSIVESIGVGAVTGEDSVFVAETAQALSRRGIDERMIKVFGEGEQIRDWAVEDGHAFFPYDSDGRPHSDVALGGSLRSLWPFRALLERRIYFGKTPRERGMKWWEYAILVKSTAKQTPRLAYAEVATHNHFVLDRGGKVFKQTAPIIKLPEGASEEDHLALLGYLNSSTACFWMKQVAFKKEAHSEDRPEKGNPDESRYAFNGSALEKLPAPSFDELRPLVWLVREIERLVTERERFSALAVANRILNGGAQGGVSQCIANSNQQNQMYLRQIVSLQEDLDWCVYRVMRLASGLACERSSPACELKPGDRPFALDVPPHGLKAPDAAIWAARRRARTDSKEIEQLETAVFKRKWWGARGVFAHKVATYPENVASELLHAVSDLVEQVVSRSARPPSVRDVIRELKGHLGLEAVWIHLGYDSMESCLDAVTQLSAVPFCAPLWLSDTGLLKHSDWQRTWDLQRREDAGEQVDIAVPPKYDQKDYRDPIYWRLRGKLDVPKERFISYPGAERDDDNSPLIGWASWDHLQRAQALAALYLERKNQDGWEKERLKPLLAGLLELVPWLKQWHNAPDEDSAKDRAGDAYATFVEAEARALGFTLDDLRAWRPEERRGKGRGRTIAVRPAQDEGAPSGAPTNGAAQGELALETASPGEAPLAPAKKPRRKKAKAEEAAE